MNAAQFSPDTWELIRLLDRHRVAYVIVGGEAVIHYGHARLTGDVDFFYGTTPDNAARLFEALRDFWGGEIPGVVTVNDLTPDDQVIQFGRPPNRIDLLTTISGLSFPDVWDARQRLIADDGTPVFMISRDHLIQNKMASGRPKDLDDVAFLRGTSQRSG